MSKRIFPQLILSLILMGLILPSFSLGLEPPIEPPETIGETKELIEKGGQKIVEETPGIIKEIWRDEVLPIWGKMWDWFKGLWQSRIQPLFSNLWYSTLKPQIQSLIQKAKGLIGREIEERTPEIKEEFEKEKEEMIEQVPEVSQSLWQRFKELFK